MPWGGYNAHWVSGINPHVHSRADALMSLRFANAEQAKKTGGMIALALRPDDAHKLVVPGGEPLEDLHLTMAYLGEDVSDQDPTLLQSGLAEIANHFTVINARVMSHATFNPDRGPDGDMDPCSVYLISDNDQLPDLHAEVIAVASHAMDLPHQHTPWIPHVTAGYNLDQGQLTYTGPVLFDRLLFAFQGSHHFYPLVGSNTPEEHTEDSVAAV